MTDQELIDLFNLEGADRGQRTRDWYAARIVRYLDYLDKKPLAQTTAIDVKRFFADLREVGFSWSTRNGSYTALSVFYRWLKLRGHIRQNPFEAETISRPRKPRRIKPDLHLASVQTVLDVLAGDNSSEAKRDAAIILLMVDSGLRRMEVAGLNISNVNLMTGRVAVLVAKNDDQRWSLASDVTRQAVARWLDVHPRADSPSQALFVALTGPTANKRISERRINGILDKWSCEAGLGRKLRPHDLRRLFVTTFADRGGGLSVIQALVGHANIKTTEGYIVTQEAEIVAQHRRNSPGNFLHFTAK